MVRLSVIIPGYRTADWQWERCLRSALAAVGSEGEIICVDDGSPRRPKPNVADSRIRWILLENNVGQAAARNIALREVQGEYVAFADSDDEIIAEGYCQALSALDEDGSDVAVFNGRTVWEDEGIQRISGLGRKSLAKLDGKGMDALVRARMFDTVWSKIYRRMFLEAHSIRFPEQICPGEDTMFNLECVMQGARWSTVSGIGYVYYRQDGTSLSRYQDNLENTLAYWKTHWDSYLSTIGSDYKGWWPTRDYSPRWVAKKLWDNMWMRRSPVSFHTKWMFARSHREALGGVTLLVVGRALVRSFLRRYCYFMPIRRWHLRKTFRDIQNI